MGESSLSIGRVNKFFVAIGRTTELRYTAGHVCHISQGIQGYNIELKFALPVVSGLSYKEGGRLLGVRDMCTEGAIYLYYLSISPGRFPFLWHYAGICSLITMLQVLPQSTWNQITPGTVLQEATGQIQRLCLPVSLSLRWCLNCQSSWNQITPGTVLQEATGQIPCLSLSQVVL